MSKIIDNYLLKEVVGQGQYGKVYKATQLQSEETFAVKVIKLEKFKMIPKLHEFTINEIQTLSKIKNQNIIRFIEMLRTSNNVYLIYDYCNGGTLEDIIKKRKMLTEKDALEIFQQILNAFKILFKENILHRDLKPSNILFHDGVIKVADFGFCKTMLGPQDLTQTMVGSPIYMAPEILKGCNYNLKSDIWSMGVVLFEMLFGYCPYEDKTIARLILQIDSKPLLIPKNKNNISKQTEELLIKMLTVDPKKRIEWQQLLSHPLFEDYLNKQSAATIPQQIPTQPINATLPPQPQHTSSVQQQQLPQTQQQYQIPQQQLHQIQPLPASKQEEISLQSKIPPPTLTQPQQQQIQPQVQTLPPQPQHQIPPHQIQQQKMQVIQRIPANPVQVVVQPTSQQQIPSTAYLPLQQQQQHITQDPHSLAAKGQQQNQNLDSSPIIQQIPLSTTTAQLKRKITQEYDQQQSLMSSKCQSHQASTTASNTSLINLAGGIAINNGNGNNSATSGQQVNDKKNAIMKQLINERNKILFQIRVLNGVLEMKEGDLNPVLAFLIMKNISMMTAQLKQLVDNSQVDGAPLKVQEKENFKNSTEYNLFMQIIQQEIENILTCLNAFKEEITKFNSTLNDSCLNLEVSNSTVDKIYFRTVVNKYVEIQQQKMESLDEEQQKQSLLHLNEIIDCILCENDLDSTDKTSAKLSENYKNIERKQLSEIFQQKYAIMQAKQF